MIYIIASFLSPVSFLHRIIETCICNVNKTIHTRYQIYVVPVQQTISQLLRQLASMCDGNQKSTILQDLNQFFLRQKFRTEGQGHKRALPKNNLKKFRLFQKQSKKFRLFWKQSEKIQIVLETIRINSDCFGVFTATE